MVEVPNPNVGFDGLPPTTSSGPEQFFSNPVNPLFPADPYNNFADDLVGHYTAPPDQQFDLLPSSSRGVELFDSPVPDFPDFVSVQPVLNPNAVLNPWGPQERFSHTPESITEWFSRNYAYKRNPPLKGTLMSEDRGRIWCKICTPYELLDPHSYRSHKEEMHGVDFETGFQFWAPLEVRPIQGAVGIGFEGYCATCKKWTPLDLSKQDFGWFHHASKCQDRTAAPTVSKKEQKKKPDSPLERWSSSDEEPASEDDIKKEALRRARRGDFLRPKPPFASNSNSNPSDEGSSDMWSSNSSRSILTSNSNSNSSVNSAMSQHSLESRRKKVLRVRKRKGARASKQGLRVYQCTFCMADFANFGDWRRHEEVIHLVLEKWVCAPEGQYKSGTRECVYCDETHEEQSNIPNRCNARYCHGQGPMERVFARKDHLKQHLKRMHGITTWRPAFEKWSKKANGPRQSRCGFCSAVFEDWQLRMQHIAWEFKNGQKMSMWQGDWGLETSWMTEGKLVNFTLPSKRTDHVSKPPKAQADERPAHVRTSNSGGSRSAHPPGPTQDTAAKLQDKGKGRGLQRKQKHTGLRDGFSQQQLQEAMVQSLQLHTMQQPQQVTPPGTWSLPSSADGTYTTPPSLQQQSPLGPYCTNATGPFDIQPRPPETPATVPVVNMRRSQSFQCPYCSMKYNRQDVLRQHLKTHLVKGT
ncbi:hypothetical protein FN846DRAFT_961767 [Sphaerosporella brunnea]|uniref:C2H2-type domain-containing protein n=1 Tax=Sphaerosporella brunnea TaxID=1250544 RepID=A0A5J5EPF9_9PEZI|nr:hypothetical protein FN846DRAFT_961767 [Sphaerosporella brunnea]